MTIKRLALLTILLTYLLIVFGGYAASSKSGMGCGPEWPLCNGDVVPTLHGDTLIEFTHRVIGAAMLHLAAGTLLFALVVEARVFLNTAAFLETKLNIETILPIANKTDV